MPKMIQIRNVPEALHRRLKARAAKAGMSLSDYLLPDGERLVGFDNAHPVVGQKRGEPRDHRHRLRTDQGLRVPGCGNPAR